MPGVDNCEPQVMRALEKENWRIVEKQRRLTFKRHFVYIDFIAEKIANGSLQEMMLAEVKCFSSGQNITTALYSAIG